VRGNVLKKNEVELGPSAQILPHLIKAGSNKGQSLFIESVDDLAGILGGKLEEFMEGALRHEVQLPSLHKQFYNVS